MEDEVNKGCPICGDKDAKLGSPFESQIIYFNCPVCGHPGIAQDLLEDLSDRNLALFKEKVPPLALERSLKGEAYQRYVLVNSDPDRMKYKEGYEPINWRDFIKDFPENHEIPERVLLNLGNISKRLGDKIEIAEQYDTERNEYPLSLVFTQKSDEVNFILRSLQDLEYIGPIIKNVNTTNSMWTISLTHKAWQRINELKKVSPETKQIFVAMWFTPSRNDIWEYGIKLAIEATGYQPMKIDEKEHNNKICEEIPVEINKSCAVVADLTGHRGGVYFEAGIACARNIPVIWMLDEKQKDTQHFDVRQYNCIYYKNAEDLKKKLSKRLRETLV